MKMLPLVYFPSNVLMIDDDPTFLNNMVINLDIEIPYRTFNSPNNALAHIERKARHSSFLTQLNQSRDVEASYNEYTVKLDLTKLHQEIYNSKRFELISVIVIDYSMPGMSGLEFCTKIKNYPIKKILLTGKADEQTIINAFNTGLIDKYIPKSDEDAAAQVNQSICKLQHEFFANATQNLGNILNSQNNFPLMDIDCINWMNEVMKKNKIQEYYLISDEGDLLCLDRMGNSSVIAIKTEEDIQMYLELATNSQAPESVIKALQQRKMIPFFESKEQLNQISGSAWLTRIYPAEKIAGETTSYYSAVIKKEINLGNLNTNPILTYDKYLKTMWSPES